MRARGCGKRARMKRPCESVREETQRRRVRGLTWCGR